MFPTSAVRQQVKSVAIPAPTGGINRLDSMMTMPSSDCVSMSNLTPREYGLEVRSGYQEYAYGYDGLSAGVRTVIPFEGTAEDGSKDKLFAATIEGIYDITSSTTSPTKVYTWSSKTGDAGYCSYTSITILGGKYLLICDGKNGYIYRDEATGTWTAPTLTGVTAANLRYVTIWKNRLWFAEKDSAAAWYLDVGSITGTATAIQFGNRFSAGGFLNSLWSFTRDSGTGIDDFLVILSSAGDCLIYSGTDPDTTDFSLIGSWSLGKLPKGRRVAASVGGDLYIISSYGVISIAQVLNGTDVSAIPAYITGKISPMVSRDFASYGATVGWDLVNHVSAGLLILVVPRAAQTDTAYRQYVMNSNTRAWTRWDDVPMDTVGVYKGDLYFGATRSRGSTGSVFKLTGSWDFADMNGREGLGINSFLLTSYGSPTQDGRFIQMPTMRPFISADIVPTYDVSVAYDFDINDQLPTLVPTYDTSRLQSVWGSTTFFWGTMLFGENFASPTGDVKGGAGLGRFAAIKFRMKSIAPATLLGFEATVLSGGPL